MLLNKIDEYGKLGWIGLTVVAFWLAWPIGFLMVAYLAGSGRLRTWRAEFSMPGTWFNLGTGWGGATRPAWQGFRATSSGNKAFDQYRDETMRGLEKEQREFQAFLDRLRKARDKAEFDAFMAEQRKHAGSSLDVGKSDAG